MKLIFLRGACDNGRTCPNINVTDTGTLVIQGYEVSSPSAVRVPASLVPELVAAATPPAGVVWLEDDDVLIQGRAVTDREALDELRLPVGERAVEVPASLLPGLREGSDAG